MPAVEANEAPTAEDRSSYELAFHVLPTIAEGEVSSVLESIKTLITTNGGELFDEESPERIDLAYEIVKHLEGKNRRFTSAYFGWVRFKSQSEDVATITQGVEENTQLLRHMLIKLSKVEEAHPFYLHEALAEEKKVSTVDEAPKKAAVTPDISDTEVNKEVSEAQSDSDNAEDTQSEAPAEKEAETTKEEAPSETEPEKEAEETKEEVETKTDEEQKETEEKA